MTPLSSRLSTDYSLASAREPGVCLDLTPEQKQPKDAAQISALPFLKHGKTKFGSLFMLPPHCKTLLQKYPGRFNTHNLPRPPQTQPASFKRLYLK